MYTSEKDYGKVRMNSYLPTQRAVKFLNYYQTAGWHECNSVYRQTYDHGISGSLIIFTVKGKGILQLKGDKHTLTAGTVAIVPSDIPVSYYTYPKTKWEFYWINIYGIYVIQIISCILEEHGHVFNTGNIANYIEKVNQLIIMKDENKFCFELDVSQKITGLLHDILQEIYCNSKENSLSENLPLKITDYMEQHYTEPVRLAQLSRSFHFSENQLILIFQAKTGYTPYEYLKRYRLLKACELLQMTNNPIKEISTATGFPNVSNFIFQFKAQYGVTPCNYRKQFSSSKKLTGI